MQSNNDAVSLIAEARALIEGSRLLELLETHFGSSAVVGSVDLNLMPWRDIDVYAPVDRTQLDRFLSTGPALHAALHAAGYTVFRMVFNDEWARPRGGYGNGYYWGLRVEAPAAQVWKLDIWGWDGATFVNKLREHQALKQALAHADRGLILKLKREAMALPGFRDTITSYDVYRFVLDGGQDFALLAAMCAARSAK